MNRRHPNESLSNFLLDQCSRNGSRQCPKRCSTHSASLIWNTQERHTENLSWHLLRYISQYASPTKYSRVSRPKALAWTLAFLYLQIQTGPCRIFAGMSFFQVPEIFLHRHFQYFWLLSSRFVTICYAYLFITCASESLVHSSYLPFDLVLVFLSRTHAKRSEIGRASCRERV